MKTKNFVFSSILILFFVTGILFFVSCKKENNETLVVKDDKYALYNVGKLHNEALEYYYKNRTKFNSISSLNDILSESISLTSEYLVSQGFEKDKVLKAKTMVENSLIYNTLKGSSELKFSMNPTSFIDQLNQQNQNSVEFIENVNQLLILVQKDENEETVKDYVNNVFAKVQYSSQSDIEAQEVFVNIFNNSYNFWVSSPHTSSLKSVKMKGSSWVILNDGIGGILGSAFGPIGSIALATTFSIGTNETLKFFFFVI